MHIKRNITASCTQSIKNKIFGEIFLLDIIYDFSPNNIFKNSVVYYSYIVQNYYNLTKFKNTTNDLFLKKVVHKILASPFIIEKNKKEVRKRFIEFI